MAHKTKTTPVKGGWVKRDASTGRFLAVHSSKGTEQASKVSALAIKDVSNSRRDAMKRLANR